jgi:hypothetical protein
MVRKHLKRSKSLMSPSVIVIANIGKYRSKGRIVSVDLPRLQPELETPQPLR